MEKLEKEVWLVNQSVWTRLVSFVMAMLMVLSISVSALAVEVPAQSQGEETGEGMDAGQGLTSEEPKQEDPFDDSKDLELEPETTDPVPGQEELQDSQDGQNVEEESQQTAPTVYVDQDGHYLAPEELVVYLVAYADGETADATEPVTDYTGIVAFYDYNIQDEEERLEKPYYFYYQDGKLQKVDECYQMADTILSLPQAPELLATLTDEEEVQLSYQGEELYVDQETQEPKTYCFLFNGKEKNGLYTGSLEGVDYQDGLPVPIGEEEQEHPAIEMVGVTQEEDGTTPTLTWKADDQALGYEILRQVDGTGDFEVLTKVDGAVTSYTDAAANKVGSTYAYQVRGVYENEGTSAESEVLTYTYHAIPAVTATAPETLIRGESGVQLSWTRDEDATGYRILRKTSGQDSWQVVKDLSQEEAGSKPQWTDTSAASTSTYAYAVRAYYGTEEGADREAYTEPVWSGMTPSREVYYFAAPAMTNIFSNSAGMTLQWEKVTGATGYAVYRRPISGGSWTRIGNTASNVLTFTDKTAVADTSYFYTVRALRDKVMGPYIDGSNDQSNAVVFHGAPTVTVTLGSQFQVKWTKNVSATGYRVFRQKEGTNRWEVVANLTSGSTLSWADNGVVSGTDYRYTVRAYYGQSSAMAKDSNYNSNLWSGYKASATSKFIAAPQLGAVYSDVEGLRVTWTKSANSVGYIIYRRNAGTSSFTRVAQINNGNTNYYVDKTVKANTAYSYTVKRILRDSAGKEYASGFYYPEEDTIFHAPPQATVAASTKGNVIYWTLDSKAVAYRIYRQKANSSTEVLANIPADEVGRSSNGQGRYEDTKVSSGTKYTYAVRAYYGKNDVNKVGVDTSNDWSNAKSVTMVFLLTPTLKTTVENADNGIKISWTKVAGASGYEIYRRASNSTSWGSAIGKVSNGSTEVYIDTKAANGGSYYYTVRAYSSNSRSSYDSTGVYAYRLPTPELLDAKAASNGTTVTWKSVSGATGYQIWRKKESGSWTLLTTTTNAATLSYLDTQVKSRDVAYYYTVKAYRTATVDGKRVNIYSSYDRTGVTFGIPMSGSGWVKKDNQTYYVKNGYAVTGWQYLSRNGGNYKYYFDPKTGALVTNLYSYFGKSYRNLKCRIVTCINSSDSNPSYNTIYLYDSETDSYCIPAVSVRCVGNLSKTQYKSSNRTAYLRAGTGQRWLDSGSYEQYATYISGTYSWFHSALYFYRKSPTAFSSSSYNSLINNNNNTNGCIRMQCIYAFLIQDIMKYGYGKSNRVNVIINKNTSNAGPFGVPKVNKISSRNSDPTDPAITGKFFYDTSIWGVSAKAGASAWTYY